MEILIVGNHVDFPVNSYQQVRWVKTMIKLYLLLLVYWQLSLSLL